MKPDGGHFVRLLCILLLITVSTSGCLVRSVHSWLGSETAVEQPILLGTWIDREKNDHAIFLEGADGKYRILLQGDGLEDHNWFEGKLHHVDDVLLLDVLPLERDDREFLAVLPLHLLFRVSFDKETMNIRTLHLDSFDDRAAAAGIATLAETGDPVVATTEELEAFVRTNLTDSTFFDAEPLYSLQRIMPR
ncbi:MAG: hypothetical protein QGG85_08840 [Candidatus Marinimicrobia bacterium]|jgi:hypothetical protein|nr:hypothetical protein [Candidatus Neomarinimicrobiota bacterium]MDP7059256.1 hypothetical protein [Candidatus Neomarinimicrobiota bacterium]|tara:strand:- start:878 stop:1453 length:576 start_codon:yes stop_codon:yes gene_type:complete